MNSQEKISIEFDNEIGFSLPVDLFFIDNPKEQKFFADLEEKDFLKFNEVTINDLGNGVKEIIFPSQFWLEEKALNYGRNGNL